MPSLSEPCFQLWFITIGVYYSTTEASLFVVCMCLWWLGSVCEVHVEVWQQCRLYLSRVSSYGL